MATLPLPVRTLGRTGATVTTLGLGGEGVLRTHGRTREAVSVIHAALAEGVTYFDTAPAYDGSRDYLGAALGKDRARIFLASKTHDRTASGTRALLEDSLTRLKTGWVDLLQLHDLRTMGDVDRIFSKGGAMEAVLKAREEGLCRHIGLTGHQDPGVLLEAMRRFQFDTVLTVVNPAEPTGRHSFMRQVIPEARRQGMGVIAMKVFARGRVFSLPGTSTPAKALAYAWGSDVDVAIVGCVTPVEVQENAQAARTCAPMDASTRARLEEEAAPEAAAINPWKSL